MKRLLLLLGLTLLMSASAFAQKDFGSEHLKLRNDIERFLREEGFMPELDSDGDITFKRQGYKYSVLIDDRDTSPLYLSLTKSFKYDATYNRTAIASRLDKLNMKKGVKTVLFDTYYSLQAEMYLVSADTFNYAFYKLLKQLDALEDTLEEVCSGGGSSGSGSSYSSGSGSGYGGTYLVNEQFSSTSYKWTKDDGRLTFKNGKMIFEDLEDYGYSVLSYDLPRNLKNEDFQLSFNIDPTFKEQYSSLFFFFGDTYNSSYTLGMSDSGDGEMALKCGTYEEMGEYWDYNTDHGLSPYGTYQYTMIKRGTRVEWYAGGKFLCSYYLTRSYPIDQIGFFLSSYHQIDIDDVTIKLL